MGDGFIRRSWIASLKGFAKYHHGVPIAWRHCMASLHGVITALKGTLSSVQLLCDLSNNDVHESSSLAYTAKLLVVGFMLLSWLLLSHLAR
jgi:hypothetical protein